MKHEQEHLHILRSMCCHEDHKAEEQTRLLGITHGLVSALATMKLEIGRLNQLKERIPVRYTVRRSAFDAKLAPLKAVYDRIETELRRLQAVYQEREKGVDTATRNVYDEMETELLRLQYVYQEREKVVDTIR